MKLPFGVKIGLAISMLAVGATSGSLVYFYNHSRTMLLEQMGNRLKDIGRTSVYLFEKEDIAAIVRLKKEIEKKSLPVELVIDDIKPGDYRRSLKEDDANAIMASDEFQRIVGILQKIKDSTRNAAPNAESTQDIKEDRPTLAYTTIITTIPSATDRKVIRFIADADYADPEFPNPAGNLFYNNSEAIREAFDGKVVADQDFRYEDAQSLLSAGIPMFDDKGDVIAILSLDYDAKSEVNMVGRLKDLCIGIVVASFLLSLLVAFFLAQLLNRPIRKLREGADRVRSRDFNAKIDLQSNDELGLLANAFNAMVEEISSYSRNLEAHNAAYAKFVPKEFLQHLGHSSILDIQLGDQVQRQMTILFADIRSFTSISESMSPRDNFDFINEYLKTVSPVIRRNNGFVDKYIGDAVMALFPDGAENALNAAVEMIGSLETFNKEGAELGRPAINIGIGLHTGNLMLGTIGESMRMEGTVIADAVNLSSRLEGLTKTYGADIIISEKVYSAVSERCNRQIRALGSVQVKGKRNFINIYEVVDARQTDNARRKIITKKAFERALRALNGGDRSRAAALLEKVIRFNKHDLAAKHILGKLRTQLSSAQKKTEVIELDADLLPSPVKDTPAALERKKGRKIKLRNKSITAAQQQR